jgi:hypothetical protein
MCRPSQQRGARRGASVRSRVQRRPARTVRRHMPCAHRRPSTRPSTTRRPRPQEPQQQRSVGWAQSCWISNSIRRTRRLPIASRTSPGSCPRRVSGMASRIPSRSVRSRVELLDFARLAQRPCVTRTRQQRLDISMASLVAAHYRHPRSVPELGRGVARRVNFIDGVDLRRGG